MKMQRPFFTLAIFGGVVIATSFLFNNALAKTVAKPMSEEQSVLSSPGFEVIDPYTDRKLNGDGTATHRFYTAPRLLYTDIAGKLQKRPDGWNFFNENPDLQVRDGAESGYAFAVPFSDGAKILVTAGNFTQDQKSFAPRKIGLERTIEDFASISRYRNLYDGVEVQFRDAKQWRERRLIIGERPKELAGGDTLLFWETYRVPEKVKVTQADGSEIKEGESVSFGGLVFTHESGEKLTISSPLVFDSVYEEAIARDLASEQLSYQVRYDKKTRMVSAGIVLPASYLLSAERVYPVTIDPSYLLCTEGGPNNLPCTITDYFVRAANGNPDSPSALQNTDLFVGMWRNQSNGIYYTRHPIVRFSTTFNSLVGTVRSATLNFYYRNFGNGTSDTLDLTARRINRSWDSSQPLNYNYTFFRNSLVTENPAQSINRSPTGRWLSLNVRQTVEQWRTGSPNYGFLMEEDPAWPTGTRPPASWEDRLLHLDSSRHSDATSPYLEVVTDAPDLTVSNVSLPDPSMRLSGQAVTVQARVQNLGTASGVAAYRLRAINIQSGATFDLTNLAPVNLGALAAGYDQIRSVSGTVPNGIPISAAYRIEVMLDPANAIAESNEGNNSANSTNTIVLERESYSGGGGMTSSTQPDYDGDTFYDLEEKTAGSNVFGPQSVSLYDSNFRDRQTLISDRNQKVVEVGDPVNARTGAFDLTETDYDLPGRGVPLAFTRSYNSRIPDYINRLGYGWTFSFNTYYFLDPTSQNILLNFGFDHTALFNYNNGAYTPDNGVQDQLTRNPTTGTITYKTLDNVSYIFSRPVSNRMGVLESIVDREGNTTRFIYTIRRDVPLLTAIQDPSGREFSIIYGDAAGLLWDKIARIEDRLDPLYPRVSTYEYNGQGDLARVRSNRTYLGGQEWREETFTYGPEHEMLTYTDPRGTVLTNVYDPVGRVLTQYENNPRIDAPGARGRLIYRFNYLPGPYVPAPEATACTVVDNFRDATAAYSTRDCFNSNGLLVYRADGAGNATRFGYGNPYGLPSSKIDPNGRETRYEYDFARRLSHEILPDTAEWHTEIFYEYSNSLNLLTRRRETVSAVSNPGTPIFTREWNYLHSQGATGRIMRATDPLGRLDIYEYDQYGNLLHQFDRRNNDIYFEYDAGGNYLIDKSVGVSLANGSGQKVAHHYTYDVYGNRITMRNPNFRTTRYEYDSRGNLRRETDPLGREKIYGYDIEGHRTTLRDEAGNSTTFAYDTDINASLLREERLHPTDSTQNIIIRHEYDYVGNKTKDIDPLNRETRYFYDAANRVNQTITPLDTFTYTYDANGNLREERNSLNQITRHLYDSRNQKIQTTRYAGANETVPLVERWVYDGLGRVTRATDPRGSDTVYTYDAVDNRLSMTDAMGNRTTYAYDVANNRSGELWPRAQTDPTRRNSRGFSVSYQYDQIDRKMNEINADDKETWTIYDRASNVVQVIDRRDVVGNSSHSTVYTYDDLNRRLTETDAANRTRTFTYDAVGNKLTDTDKNGNTTAFAYDAFYRLIVERDPAGGETRYTYDKVGNRTGITYADQTSVAYAYDAGNRLTTVTDALRGARRFTYDAAGNKLSEIDKRGMTASFGYDLVNRLARETDPAGAVTSYAYDANGNRVSETVAGLAALATVYDALNRPTLITHPGNKTEAFTYDADGNRSTHTDGNSQTITYIYDRLNRVVEKQLPSGDSVRYAYDNWDNLLTLTDAPLLTTYTYDNLNRVTGETHRFTDLPANTYTIARAYDGEGNLATLTDAAGRLFTYIYNTRNLLDRVNYNGQSLAIYTYNAMRRPTQLMYQNGTRAAYTYDALNRLALSAITNTASATLWQQTYAYDAESNRTGMVENDTRQVAYTYDEREELTSATYQDGAAAPAVLSYQYDARGNRTGYTAPIGSAAYTYANNSNELNTITQGILSIGHLYDNNGSLTQEAYTRGNRPLRTVNYTWDSQNRLSAIGYQRSDRPAFLPPLSDNTVRFAYDDFGNRIKKTTVNGLQTTAETYYLNDGLTVLNELNNAGAVQKSIVKGISQIAEIDAIGTITYIHQDVLGSTVLLTDQAANVVAEYEYDPFGQIMGQSETNGKGTNYLFTNQEWDPETELYYYNARYYNPSVGRFISRDNANLGQDGDTVSKNRYTYVNNNPLKYTDPTGENKEKAGWWQRIKDFAVDTADNFVDLVGGTGYSIAENYTYGLSTINNPPPSSLGGVVGRGIGDALTYAASTVEMLFGGSIAASGVALSPFAFAGAPVTAGGSIALDAGAIAAGGAIAAHGGSVMMYAAGKDSSGGDNNFSRVAEHAQKHYPNLSKNQIEDLARKTKANADIKVNLKDWKKYYYNSKTNDLFIDNPAQPTIFQPASGLDYLRDAVRKDITEGGVVR